MAVTYSAMVEYIQKRLFCDLWSQDSNSLQLSRVSFPGESTQTKHLSKILIARDMKSCRKLGSLEPGSQNFCSFCNSGDMFCFLRFKLFLFFLICFFCGIKLLQDEIITIVSYRLILNLVSNGHCFYLSMLKMYAQKSLNNNYTE